MKYYIIEDEALAAEKLQDMMAELRPQWPCLGQLASAEEAYRTLKEKPSAADLLFVDIHLSDGYAFDFLEPLQLSTPLIFTTAYDRYALRAFKHHSLDYLLKPIAKDQLERALQKREQQAMKSGASELNHLRQSIAASAYLKRLLVHQGARLRTLPCSQLARIQASGKNCLATDFEGQEYYLDRSLRYYSERLDPAVFFQINRQLLIHVESLVELIPYSKSRYKLVLRPPLREAAIVSVERSARFKQWLEGS